jgi:hypothetical protein
MDSSGGIIRDSSTAHGQPRLSNAGVALRAAWGDSSSSSLANHSSSFGQAELHKILFGQGASFIDYVDDEESFSYHEVDNSIQSNLVANPGESSLPARSTRPPMYVPPPHDSSRRYGSRQVEITAGNARLQSDVANSAAASDQAIGNSEQPVVTGHQRRPPSYVDVPASGFDFDPAIPWKLQESKRSPQDTKPLP